MRRPVRINYVWHAVRNLNVLIPATAGELEELPPGGGYEADLFWLLPEGGAASRRLTRRELEECLRFRQLEYSDIRAVGRRVDFPENRR